MMTTPATAIKNEIRQLINLHIEVFGRPSPLTPSELEECRRRAERIRLLGQELDRISLLTNTDERFREVS
jgi:hypothetical protein